MAFPNVQTKVVVILGSPLEHSLSPFIHNTAFQHQGLNFVYLAASFPEQRLQEALHGLSALGFAGANVTIPYKQAVLPYMDHLSEPARAIGAVNTIICKNDQIYGDNTDIEGFLSPLRDLELQRMPMVVLGAGGSARAVVYGLLKEYTPNPLTLVARRVRQAEKLAADLASFGGKIEICDFASASKSIQDSRLIVNTTPLGMYPHVENTPWKQPQDFSPGQIVYDLVYLPNPTRLIQEAGRRGASTIGGLTMLVEQAASAYRQWTEQDMPVAFVRESLTRHLQGIKQKNAPM